jgi:tetratricopeptide (TPR) repeat protein
MPGVAFPTAIALGAVVGRLGALDRRRTKGGWRILPPVWLPLWGAAALAVIAAQHAATQTLDADYARMRAVESGSPDAGEVRAAILRHPADDYLELVAARAALPTNPGEAMHHLNRALRLHPANWQAHRLAARALLALRRPSQAALEYRLGLATGMPFDPAELTRMLAGHVVDAVPQTPGRLVELARWLYAIGRSADADAAAQRAVELSEVRAPMLMTRVQLALEAKAPDMLIRAARALRDEADSVEAFALAARGLAGAGASAQSNQTIDSALKHYPGNPTLLLAGAELRSAAGDFAGSRAVLGRLGKATLTLAERQRAEELMAEVSERSGDAEAAALARARARLIAKKRHDMTFSGE